MKSKKFDNFFTQEELESITETFQIGKVYSITKRSNPDLFNSVSIFVPPGYYRDKKHDIESMELIVSGSNEKPFQITLCVGRKDRFRGSECYDIDVFNITPESGSSDSYFLNQWHHIQDGAGQRISKIISHSPIFDDIIRTDLLYATYLTGSLISSSLHEYERLKPEFYNIHQTTFGKLD